MIFIVIVNKMKLILSNFIFNNIMKKENTLKIKYIWIVIEKSTAKER